MITPAPCDIRPGSPAVSLWYIAGGLGQRERSTRWLCSHIDRLIADEGFPPPIPFYIGARRITAAHGSARWRREAVDAWFDGLTPPALAERMDAALAARFAETLDARAAQLAGVAA